MEFLYQDIEKLNNKTGVPFDVSITINTRDVIKVYDLKMYKNEYEWFMKECIEETMGLFENNYILYERNKKEEN